MPQLTQEGQRVVNDLAQNHGFSPQAVEHMLFALKAGNGTMAQFNHPEFAGYGQWMQGGMVMLGDMFNSSLKQRVDNLCQNILTLLSNQPGLLQSGSFQAQSQGGNSEQRQANFSGSTGPGSSTSALFMPDPKHEWWPKELGNPNATGSQNNLRYAYFATTKRLAVDVAGSVWVYDTLDHNIGGFSQQQGAGGAILFTSQYGVVDLTRLPVVLKNGQAIIANTLPPLSPPLSPPPSNISIAAPSIQREKISESDIFSAIERLGDLKAKGILTDEEFQTKKTELLRRL